MLSEDETPQCEYKERGGCSSPNAIIPIQEKGKWKTFCYKHSLDYHKEQEVRKQKEIILEAIKELKEEGKI